MFTCGFLKILVKIFDLCDNFYTSLTRHMTIDNDQADRHHWEILSPQKILIHKILGQIDELLTIV